MDDNHALRAWALGGDARYKAAVRALRESGLPVKTYAVPGMPDEAPSLEDALSGAELLILPFRACTEEHLQIGPERVELALLPQMLAPHAILVGGWFPDTAEQWLRANGIHCRSILEAERFQIRNAAVTAEAAVGEAMDAMTRTIFGADVLVIGWGRIGKQLSEKLHALGARVTVAARRETHRTEIETRGMRSEFTGEYRHGLDYDLIVNTVPAPVLRKEQAERIEGDCVLMELASDPGGFPPGLPVRRCGGLPGRRVPETAGENLAEAVWDCLTGEGRPLE